MEIKNYHILIYHLISIKLLNPDKLSNIQNKINEKGEKYIIENTKEISGPYSRTCGAGGLNAADVVCVGTFG